MLRSLTLADLAAMVLAAAALAVACWLHATMNGI
jgi:hypothetical protein